MIDYFNARSGDTLADPRHWGWLSLIIDGSLMLGAVTVVGLIAAAIASASMVLGYLSPMGAVLILVALAMLLRNARRSRAMVAMNYLEQAVRLNLPLPGMLEAARRAEARPLRRRLERLRDALEGGAPVGIAVARSLPGVTSRATGLLICGERLGRLPQVLRRLVKPRESLGDQHAAGAIMVRWYPVAMVVAVAFVGTSVSVFLLPKLQMVFKDMGLQMPPIARVILTTWNAIEIPLVVLAAMVVAVQGGRVLSEMIPIRRAPFAPWRIMTDRLAWEMPVWRTAVRSLVLADACHMIAAALEVGQPMDRALAEAIEAADNRVLRHHLWKWAQAVSAGTPLAQAARQARMPALMIGMLGTARAAAGARETFAFLARYYEGRFSAAAAFLRGAAVPVMVGIAAVFVTALALGVFVPLANLAEHVSGIGGKP